MSARLRLWLILFILPWLTILPGCGTVERIIQLPPALCKPASDLTSPKYLTKLPEREVTNDELYGLFVEERADHAGDVRDFNSLLRTCVDPTMPEKFPVFSE